MEAPLTLTYTYRIPENLRAQVQPGSRVVAPFGGRKIRGFCVAVKNTCACDPQKCKEIISAGPEAEIVFPELLQLTNWVAKYYHCGWGMVLAAAVPSAVRLNKQAQKILTVTRKIDLATWQIYREQLTAKKSAQIAVSDFFLQHDNNETPREFLHSVLIGEHQLSTSALRTLAKKDFLLLQEKTTTRPQTLLIPPAKKIHLTDEQQSAIDAITAAISTDKFAPFLLYGITGSGKTEVYLRAMKHALHAGKSVLILVPEISLTPQTVGRFAQNADEVLTLHSNLNDGERASAWRRLRSGEVRVVVGARSAVFSPLPNLGLIIVDEEHEHTYKQENEPRYHGRDLAVWRASSANATIILGSATPSLESYHNAGIGKYQLLSLTVRPNNAKVAQTKVVNMVEEFREQKKVVTFSRLLIKELTACLERQEQAILFLNRRGFNTEVRCKNCGEPLYCEHCTISLTYHRRAEIMRCHYCDYSAPPPTKCPICQSPSLQFFGTGTERVEKILSELFPSARLLRMDSDTMKGTDAYGQALSAFANGEYDILLGTQMVTKGFDFPNVTLVGVLAGDGAINLPDFRAAEKTFQLITQVIGRAGRAQKTGVAVIQAYNPEHYAVQYALKQDFTGFAEYELREREPLNYPPFGRLARVVVRGQNENEVKTTLSQIATLLKEKAPRAVLGPAPCVIEKLHGDYRYHLLIKANNVSALQKLLALITPFFGLRKDNLRCMVDVDPIAMM